MKNDSLIFLFISFWGLFILHSCQNETKNLQQKENYHKILIDSLLEIKFLLDTSQIYITAINFKNDTLWRTDPWKDNGLPYYRDQKPNRPVIWIFDFLNNEFTQNKEMIRINYSNSQFGNIDKLNGKFFWLGQD